MPITISSVNMEERRKLDLRAGDTVRVTQKITERVMEKDKVKEKKRLQAFEGLVLARKHGREAGSSFTVRRIIGGIGVERIFPLYAPTIEKIEVLKRAKVRRAKLYHIRRKAAKEIRKAMRHERMEQKEIKTETTPVASVAETPHTA
ncbi:MAG: 50S ribosomal protein L19 [Candidatus Taylorbacteria bacterium RIFCSPHIGHO2_02_FULL_47_18]|uniref:50S ribosomal protein L19 n=1 Tax=Candidatus Taylorbacteria bacterium RIFCSPLOWO2_01_FULL_48_100 TaxID=1802322 RepID=A0A1G2NET2_9BACT|nr:MAG: 50S ribosomal protein L19 [Candidatus Taylorbacteria bacterium RIFCSPHIGHO2_01_FULL_48_38]OHA27503.1 MAG: 50S ribosomal protein L19 [Candidatus Taylorbacteria bacterium RIFCSPHIGHO2_02_FULL_47_18]OHA34566.1 MAG: 50S ribosomal protein L19 [Candidatus Taylorbacteria bacterium RIFCSPLOWO2_01_FULL_48_100]OHA40330.1 MAG: 50S ribosomal protein L19 [Candidatus Taylorbacteria bacterium RIFCSPLOWO2_02_FULL_48_16]